ncbi:hypothetical protein FACS1894217_12110 [Clostridia bacterium]|nr:hypothetical protein FACS1894217_12110 [Clostridia bacterium]
MVYVGIDVAKHTHYACVADECMNILAEPFPFANNESGFAKLLGAIGKRSAGEVTVGLEANANASPTINTRVGFAFVRFGGEGGI